MCTCERMSCFIVLLYDLFSLSAWTHVSVVYLCVPVVFLYQLNSSFIHSTGFRLLWLSTLRNWADNPAVRFRPTLHVPDLPRHTWSPPNRFRAGQGPRLANLHRRASPNQLSVNVDNSRPCMDQQSCSTRDETLTRVRTTDPSPLLDGLTGSSISQSFLQAHFLVTIHQFGQHLYLRSVDRSINRIDVDPQTQIHRFLTYLVSKCWHLLFGVTSL